MKATLFLCVAVISMLTGEQAYGDIKNMPSELVEFAEKSGCVQVSDFYNRSGAVGPPFVYGYLPGKQDDSVTFWCKSGGRCLNGVAVACSPNARPDNRESAPV